MGIDECLGVDKDGTSLWVGERCGANTCLNSPLDPILEFHASGALVRSFGAGTMVLPHGMFVDRDGNIYGAEVGPRAVKKYSRIANP